VKEKLIPHLENQDEWRLSKYWAHTDPACPNYQKLYELANFQSSYIRQFLSK